ncbi:O-antigen ligase family protein [Paludibacterium purpuratum]|uniref:O-antigen ligase family protein n=1 Tax=Paludibacterium purpuratum TaxID=1144873 RepID=UPI001414EF3B|nr:O-antigen ligase family protein [Paludibacterium purpuratum]
MISANFQKILNSSFFKIDDDFEISSYAILNICLWAGIWYVLWIWIRWHHGASSFHALATVTIGFLPLALLALWNYKYGLLITIATTPLFIAPTIPHSFTQGFGDLEAACTITGYFLRSFQSREWRSLWKNNYIWLLAILVAASISLINSPLQGKTLRYGIKYGVAEIFGYILVMTFMVLLSHEIKNREKLETILQSTLASLITAIALAVAGIWASAICVGGYGAQTMLTSNGYLIASFDNPNYFSNFLIYTLPISLYFSIKFSEHKWKKTGYQALALMQILLVQATGSRSGLIGLVAIYIGWLIITRLRPKTRIFTAMFTLCLPLTLLVWWLPACTCGEAQAGICVPAQFLPFNNSDRAFSAPSIPSTNRGSVFSLPVSPPAGHGSLSSLSVAPTAIHDRALSTPSIPDEVEQLTTKSQKGLTSPVRLGLLLNAVKVWKQNPFTGVGVGLLPNISTVDHQVNRAHSVFLTTLAEQGILGLMTWLGWLCTIGLSLWRARASSNITDSLPSFLLLTYVSAGTQALFFDQNRVIWLWQFSAIAIAVYVMTQREQGPHSNGMARQVKQILHA